MSDLTDEEIEATKRLHHNGEVDIDFEPEVIDRLKLLEEKDFDKTSVDDSYIKYMLQARDVLLEVFAKIKQDLGIYKSHYSNLRYNFDKITTATLGKDYYNYGCDVYTCDNITADDILAKRRKIIFNGHNIKLEESINDLIHQLEDNLYYEFASDKDLRIFINLLKGLLR